MSNETPRHPGKFYSCIINQLMMKPYTEASEYIKITRPYSRFRILSPPNNGGEFFREIGVEADDFGDVGIDLTNQVDILGHIMGDFGGVIGVGPLNEGVVVIQQQLDLL